MRQTGRRKPKARCNAYGQYYGMGKQSEDHVSGFWFPKSQMTRQRGGLVSRRDRDGSIDRTESW